MHLENLVSTQAHFYLTLISGPVCSPGLHCLVSLCDLAHGSCQREVRRVVQSTDNKALLIELSFRVQNL